MAAPMVFVVLAGVRPRLRVRHLRDGAELVAAPAHGANRTRRADDRPRPATPASRAAAAPSAARWTLTAVAALAGARPRRRRFVLGWLASRLDARQYRRERQDSPKVYYKG
jgi:hypothetical protein